MSCLSHKTKSQFYSTIGQHAGPCKRTSVILSSTANITAHDRLLMLSVLSGWVYICFWYWPRCTENYGWTTVGSCVYQKFDQFCPNILKHLLLKGCCFFYILFHSSLHLRVGPRSFLVGYHPLVSGMQVSNLAWSFCSPCLAMVEASHWSGKQIWHSYSPL